MTFVLSFKSFKISAGSLFNPLFSSQGLYWRLCALDLQHFPLPGFDFCKLIQRPLSSMIPANWKLDSKAWSDLGLIVLVRLETYCVLLPSGDMTVSPFVLITSSDAQFLDPLIHWDVGKWQYFNSIISLRTISMNNFMMCHSPAIWWVRGTLHAGNTEN